MCIYVCVCVFVNDRNTHSTESFDERDLDHSVISERIQRFVVFEQGRCEEARVVPLLNDTYFPIRDDTQFFNRVPRDRFGDVPEAFFVFVSMDKNITSQSMLHCQWYAYLYIYIYIYVCMYECMLNVHVRICMYVYMYICMHV